MANEVPPVRVRVRSDLSDATGRRYVSGEVVEIQAARAAIWLELGLAELVRVAPEHTALERDTERAVVPRPRRGRPQKRR